MLSRWLSFSSSKCRPAKLTSYQERLKDLFIANGVTDGTIVDIANLSDIILILLKDKYSSGVKVDQYIGVIVLFLVESIGAFRAAGHNQQNSSSSSSSSSSSIEGADISSRVKPIEQIAEFIDILTQVNLCISSIHIRALLLPHLQSISSGLLHLLESKDTFVSDNSELIFAVLKCLIYLASHLYLSSSAMTKFLLICCEKCSIDHPSKLLFLEAANDIIESGETRIYGKSVDILSSETKSINTVTELLFSAEKYSSEIESPTGCFSKRLAVMSFKLSYSQLFKSTASSSSSSSSITRSGCHKHCKLSSSLATVSSIFAPYYCQQDGKNPSGKTSSSGTSPHKMLKSAKKYIMGASSKKRAPGAVDLKGSWPPVNTGYSVNVWFRISSNGKVEGEGKGGEGHGSSSSRRICETLSQPGFDSQSESDESIDSQQSKVEPAEIHFILCEVASTSTADDASTPCPAMSLYINNRMEVEISFSDIPTTTTTSTTTISKTGAGVPSSSSSPSATLDRQLVFRKLPKVTFGDWHFISLTHDTVHPSRQSLRVALDGVYSEEESVNFPKAVDVNNNTTSTSSSSSEHQQDALGIPLEMPSYSLFFGMQLVNDAKDADKTIEFDDSLEFQLGTVSIFSHIFTSEQSAYMYALGHDYGGLGLVANDNTILNLQLEYCSDNLAVDVLNTLAKDINTRNIRYNLNKDLSASGGVPVSSSSRGTPQNPVVPSSASASAVVASAATRSKVGYSLYPDSILGAGTSASTNNSITANNKMNEKYHSGYKKTSTPEVPQSKVMLSISTRWTAESTETFAASKGGKLLVPIQLLAACFVPSAVGSRGAFNSEQLLIILQLISISSSPVLFALSIRLLSSITRSSTKLRRALSKSYMTHMLTCMFRLKALQGVFTGVGFNVLDMITSVSLTRVKNRPSSITDSLHLEPGARGADLWTTDDTGYGDDENNDNGGDGDDSASDDLSQKFEILADYKLFKMICLNPCILSVIDCKTFKQLLNAIRTRLFLPPPHKLHKVNKTQLIRAQTFQALLSLLFEENMSTEGVRTIVATAAHMIRTDMVTPEDCVLLSNMFIAVTVTPPQMSIQGKFRQRDSFGTLEVEGKDSSVGRLARAGGLLGSTSRKITSKIVASNNISTTATPTALVAAMMNGHSAASRNRIDILRRADPDQFKLARQAVGSILLYATCWSNLSSQFLSRYRLSTSQLASNASGGKIGLASQIKRQNAGVINSLPESPSEKSSEKDASGAFTDVQSTKRANSSIVSDADYANLHHPASHGGAVALKSIVDSFPSEQLLFSLMQLSEIVTNDIDTAKSKGAVRYSRRRRDPLSALLLLQYLSAAQSSYPDVVCLKSAYTKELEFCLCGITQSLLLNFPAFFLSSSPDSSSNRFVDGAQLPPGSARFGSSFLKGRVSDTTVKLNSSSSGDSDDIIRQFFYYAEPLGGDTPDILASEKFDTCIERKTAYATLLLEASFDLLFCAQGASLGVLDSLLSCWAGDTFDPVYSTPSLVSARTISNRIANIKQMNLPMMLSLLSIAKTCAASSTCEGFLVLSDFIHVSGVSRAKVAVEQSNLAESIAVTIICSFISMFNTCIDFRSQVRRSPAVYGSSSSSSSSSKSYSLFIEECSEYIVQIFYAAAKANVLEALGNSRSSLGCNSPAWSPTSTIGDDRVSVQLGKGDSDVVSEEEWEMVSREIINKCCRNTICLLCAHMLAVFASQDSFVASSAQLQAQAPSKMELESVFLCPPQPSSPPLPARVGGAISCALNCLVRQKIVTLVSKSLETNDFPVEVIGNTGMKKEFIMPRLSLASRAVELAVEFEVEQCDIFMSGDPSQTSAQVAVQTCSRALDVINYLSKSGLLDSDNENKKAKSLFESISSATKSYLFPSSIKFFTEAVLLLQSTRYGILRLIDYSDHRDEFLCVSTLEFIERSDESIFGRPGGDDVASAALFQSTGRNDLEFTTSLVSILYFLLLQSPVLRESAVKVWALLLTSPLSAHVIKMLSVTDKNKNKIDLWKFSSGGFVLIQQKSPRFESFQQTVIHRISFSSSPSSDRDFFDWFDGLSEWIKVSLQERFGVPSAHPYRAKTERSISITNFSRALKSSSKQLKGYVMDLAIGSTDASRWHCVEERFDADSRLFISYAASVTASRQTDARALLTIVTLLDREDERIRLYELRYGNLYLHTMQRKVDTLALNVSYGDGGEGAPSRPSSLPYAAPNPAGDSSAADTDSTASDLAAYAGSAALSSAEGSNAINFAVPPLWRSNHSSPTAWFRSAIGRIAMGLDASCDVSGATVLPGISLAGEAPEGSEAGTDGTIIGVCVLIKENALGEWGLSTSEGPSRTRRRVKRGNLALLRIRDPSTLSLPSSRRHTYGWSLRLGGAADGPLVGASDNHLSSSRASQSTRMRLSVSPLRAIYSPEDSLYKRLQSLDAEFSSDFIDDLDDEDEDDDDDEEDDDDFASRKSSVSRGDEVDFAGVYRPKRGSVFTGKGLEAFSGEEEEEGGDGDNQLTVDSIDNGRSTPVEKRRSFSFPLWKNSTPAAAPTTRAPDLTVDTSSDLTILAGSRNEFVSPEPYRSSVASPSSQVGAAALSSPSSSNEPEALSTAVSAMTMQEKRISDEKLLSDTSDSNPLLHLLSPSDAVERQYSCDQILGMDVSPRVCIVGTTNLYLLSPDCQEIIYGHISSQHLIDVWLPRKARSKDRQQAAHDNVFNELITLYQESIELVRDDNTLIVRRFDFYDIVWVQKRSFLLINRAIEIFFISGQSVLMALKSRAERDDLFVYLTSKCPCMPHSLVAASSIVEPRSHRPRVVMHPYLPSHLPLAGATNCDSVDAFLAAAAGGAASGYSWPRGLSWGSSEFDSVTAKWSEGLMSNFDYLMHLNTAAGRSYSDWSCYPVFPWVLADYHSESLDLSDPAIYRDLSKPMGALTATREREAREKYLALQETAEMQDADSRSFNDKPYHYGTHYSSSAVVLYYLLRLQPFSSHAVALQAGRFDRPDRLFNSIRRCWLSASGGVTSDPSTATANLQDIRELIPEFYYLPDFLINVNGYEMGSTAKKQSLSSPDRRAGLKVADVELPPWARDSPREFVRLHRAALESEHVSAHLHLWIDLIFGQKQTGRAAEESCNCFHFLTYENSIDLTALEHEHVRKAFEEQIRNFGQTPKQLFRSPHPRRKSGSSGSAPAALSSTVSVASNSPVCECKIASRVLLPDGVGRGSFRQGLGPGSSSADVDSIGKIFISAGNVYCCNSGCALLPPYYDQMYVVGYLDASIKCLSASILPDLGNDKGSGSSSSKLCAPSSSSDWRVGGLIDVSSGSVLTAIAASEDGNVMAVGEGATGLIYIWKNSALTASQDHMYVATTTRASASIASDFSAKPGVLGAARADITQPSTAEPYQGNAELVVTDVLSASHVHPGSICCIALSAAHRLLVTGCTAGGAALWDIDTLRGAPLSVPTTAAAATQAVSSVDIDPLTGDVYVCRGPLIAVFDLNARLLATAGPFEEEGLGSVAAGAGPEHDPNSDPSPAPLPTSDIYSTPAGKHRDTGSQAQTPPSSLFITPKTGASPSTPSPKTARTGSFFSRRISIEVTAGDASKREQEITAAAAAVIKLATALCVCPLPVAPWQQFRGFAAGYSDGSVRLFSSEINTRPLPAAPDKGSGKSKGSPILKASSSSGGGGDGYSSVDSVLIVKVALVCKGVFNSDDASFLRSSDVAVTAVALSRDMTSIVAGSADGRVREIRLSQGLGRAE